MDGEPPQEEDFSQIPLVERSQHKNWKARVSAYTDVIAKSAKTASDTDPFFRPFVSDGQLLRKWCLDANAVAQEKGIEAVLAIVQYSGESSASTRGDVVPGLVEKALGAARAGTKKKGAELCAMYVEVENGAEGVMNDVLAGLDSKQPKVVAGSISTLKEIVEQFGVPTLGNIKPLLKTIPKIFGHTDKNVRAEGSNLILALYPYLGPALAPSLSELKPVQVSELQKSFDALDAEGKGSGTGKPSRFTRRVQREREAAEAVGGDDGPAEEDEAAAAPAIDPRDFLDPVNVLAQFPSDLEERLASTKWKDRLEVLEECNKVLNQPSNAKISDSNVDAYGSLVSTLGAKCKSDANVNVVMEACKVLEGLAKGMGKSFGRFRNVTMMGCLERLKERKANVVEALGKALDAIFSTVPFNDIVEDVLVSLKSKNPQVKEGTLKFLHRSLQTTTDAPGKDHIKPMAESLVALLGDSVEPVRSSAAECLGTMMKILGERVFNPYIEGVGDIQMGKVKDAFARAEIKYRAGGAKPAPKPSAGAGKPAATIKRPAVKAAAPSSPPIRPAGPASSSPPIKSTGKFNMDELEDFSAPPARAPPARFARPGAPKPAATAAPPAPKPIAPPAKKPTPAPTAGPSKSAAKAGPSKTLAVSPTEPVKFKYTPEDAAARASDVIPAEYHTKLADGAWKIRLEAADEMIQWVESGAADSVDSEILFRFLGKTPGWGEKNFQVSAKLYQVMSIMAERSPTFGKPSAALAIGPLSDKLGDMKLKKPAGDALSVFAEKTSLAFVLAQAYEPMQKQKAPKAQADALTWVKQQLVDFGIAGIPLRDLIAFVKTGLQSPNAAVRSSATQVLVTIRIFVGADISGFLEDLNPQLLSTINTEFDKVAGQAPPEPTKTSVDLREAAPAAGGKGKASGGDPLDDLIPRVDLDKIVGQTSVIADSKSDAWKVRKEAFEALNALLEVKSNSRLKPNMGEIGGVLKKAMADTNLSVKMLALGIISKIATGMGAPFEKHTKLLVAAVCSVCADQKVTTRSAGITTLSAIADACGSLDSMYSGLGQSLESPNPALRASVLGWLAERLKAEPPSPGADLAPLAAPILACLEDRNGDVRKGAGAVLPFVVQHAGYDYVMEQTHGLKPASKATILPLIASAKAAAPAPAARQAAAAAPARSATPAKTGPTASRPKVLGTPAGKAPESPRPAAAARTIAAPGRSLAMKALGPSSRPIGQADDRPTGLPKPRTLVRPASVLSQATTASSSSSKPVPFTSAAIETRTTRLKRDTQRWVLDPTSRDLAEYLAVQMEPVTAPEVFGQLFSKDHRAEEDFMAGLTVLAEFFDRTAPTIFGAAEDDIKAFQVANVDLVLKYAALRLLSNNTQLVIRCLDVVGRVVETVQAGNERFSDAEARLFVPALVMKLGDSKFGAKLTPIFETLDKVIAASQVVQLLITYGLEDKSAGKTCKNESLALIEKAYRKRGSILRTRDDRGFYEILAKCISDSGTRNAALSVMALLQIQGGSASLQGVVDKMPSSSKDMLANRRATMSTKSAPGIPAATAPVVARANLDNADGTPSRPPRPAVESPVVSRIPKDTAAAEASPVAASRGIPRSVGSPASRLPKSNVASPSTSRIAAPSAAMRALPAPSAVSRLQRPADIVGASASRSLQPLPKPTLSARDDDPIMTLINSVRTDDWDKSVIALKYIQHELDQAPEKFTSNVQTLCDALLDQLDRAFTPPENLRDPAVFRLVKHIIQSFSGFAANQDLMRRLSYDDVYALIHGLSLHLVQADRLGGLSSELVQFINMILIQTLATPDRYIVFRAMFELLLNLTKDFTENNVKPEDEVACHADLVIKCLWKRCKILDDDFMSGRLSPGALFGILEDFVRAVPPAEYRRREKLGIALGELPLRTVKTIIQKIILYAKNHGLEIYDILMGEFGDEAADAVVYTYVFRLAGPEPEKPRTKSIPSSRPLSPLLPQSQASRPASNASSHRERLDRVSAPEEQRQASPHRSVETQRQPEPEPQHLDLGIDPEVEKLVRTVTSGNQSSKLDELYRHIKTHPEQDADIQKAIMAVHTAHVGTYIRRAIEQRKAADENSSPSRTQGAGSPAKSPGRPESMPSRTGGPRKSLGPRPSSLAVVDKTAPIDDQLAQYKNVFSRSSGYLSNSQSPESANAANGDAGANGTGGVRRPLAVGSDREEKVRGGEPLSEITLQPKQGPRASDVD